MAVPDSSTAGEDVVRVLRSQGLCADGRPKLSFLPQDDPTPVNPARENTKSPRMTTKDVSTARRGTSPAGTREAEWRRDTSTVNSPAPMPFSVRTSIAFDPAGPMPADVADVERMSATAKLRLASLSYKQSLMSQGSS